MELIVCIVLVFISAFLAASEIAIFSLSRFQLKSIRENFRSSHKKIKHLLNDPAGLLVSLLIASEVVNISLSTLIVESITKHNFIPYGSMPRWAYDSLLGIVCCSPIILILCEMTPKIIAAQGNVLVAPLCVGPLSLLYFAFKPIRRLLQGLMRFIAPQHISLDRHSGRLKESEFLLLVEEGRKEGAIQQGELQLIQNVFELDDTTVSEIATPLHKVLSLSVNANLNFALNAIRSQRFSRIPVVSTNKKEVLGVLYAKDLLRAKLNDSLEPQTNPELTSTDSTTIASVMKKPFFVNPDLRLNALFRKFKQHKIHMAIVKKNDGTITGVVTMNDVLDYLFEDFFEENGEPAPEQPQ